ncbi:hypothetical protein A3Q56_00621 [Intoshia linei]|uniref:Uncharacterized protein n=1 Tax=Intoshia linei TaxID=1819745 RepID=A0A177BBE5_9BILA|nr:hypothetical protein A3Q56_00621 [Intoshia linei]
MKGIPEKCVNINFSVDMNNSNNVDIRNENTFDHQNMKKIKNEKQNSFDCTSYRNDNERFPHNSTLFNIEKIQSVNLALCKNENERLVHKIEILNKKLNESNLDRRNLNCQIRKNNYQIDYLEVKVIKFKKMYEGLLKMNNNVKSPVHTTTFPPKDRSQEDLKEKLQLKKSPISPDALKQYYDTFGKTYKNTNIRNSILSYNCNKESQLNNLKKISTYYQNKLGYESASRCYNSMSDLTQLTNHKKKLNCNHQHKYEKICDKFNYDSTLVTKYISELKKSKDQNACSQSLPKSIFKNRISQSFDKDKNEKRVHFESKKNIVHIYDDNGI